MSNRFPIFSILLIVVCRTCESACGGYVTASEGEITSPNWPQDYPINKQCTWQVVAPPQHKITVDFEDFVLEGDGVRIF